METEIRLLGGFSARRKGEEIAAGAFGGRLTRRLLRILLTRRGEFVSRDFLTEALWPRTAPADPVMNLNVLVKRARSALGNPGLILTGAGGYLFARTERCVVDAEEFLAGVESAREPLAAGRTLGALRVALDHWGGEPLPEDAYEDWAQEYRTRLLRARLEALERGAEAALRVGDPRQAIPFAELAVIQEPLRETAHLLFARALAASGDAAGALAALDRLRRRLADELGVDPSPEAEKLQRMVLRGEPLGVPAVRPAVAAYRSVLERLPFLGREEEMEALLGRVEEMPGCPVIVFGPAGVGKSRMLEEFALRCTRPVLAARAFQPEQEEAWALARSLLREFLALDLDVVRGIPDRAAQALGDVIPDVAELLGPGGPPEDPESRRALALEGATRIVEQAATKAPVIVADDLQWADATTLVWLERIVHRAPRVGLVLAYRPEDLPPDSAVTSFLAGLAGLGCDVMEMGLGPLPRRAIAQIIEGDDLVDTIVTETDGSPLAVTEVLRVSAAGGAIEAAGHGCWHAQMPEAREIVREAARAGQRRAIRARVRRQPSGCRETLSLLALLGREAPARVLGSARQEDQIVVLADLQALDRARLVRLGERGWATHHDVVGEVVAESLDAAEAARLHGVLAAALRREEDDAAEWARHLLGAGDPQAAADAFAQAAGDRLVRFENKEAEHLADAGLELAPVPRARSGLLEIRAEARGRAGNFSGAVEDLRAALGGRATGPDRSLILTTIARLTSGPDDYIRACTLAEVALTEAGGDRTARARALAVAARLDMNLNQLERAENRVAEALVLFEELEDAYGVADTLDTRAVINAHLGRIREASLMLDEVAHRFQDAGRLLRVGMPRASHGHLLIMMARPDAGLASIEEALELERTLGHPGGIAYCQWLRSEGLAALGRGEEARRSAETSLEIATRLQHREWTAAALKGLGSACVAAGELDAAEAAFRGSLDAAERLPIFSSWAASGLASVLIARGDPASAEPYVARAVREGTSLPHYDARLVRAEFAIATGDPAARRLAAEALQLAEDGGHLLSAGRLRAMLSSFGGLPERAPGQRDVGVSRRAAGGRLP